MNDNIPSDPFAPNASYAYGHEHNEPMPMAMNENIPSAPFSPNASYEQKDDQKLIVNPSEQESEQKFKINWSKLKSVLGILSIFGFVYWLIITCIAFLIQFNDKSQSWLFTYSVVSLFIALCCQCGIIAMVLVGYDEKNPITTLVIFPYALLMCIDLFVNIGSMFVGKQYIDNGFSIAFIICHFLSLFCISFLYFGWHRGDIKFRIMNFSFEWFDIFSQIIVTLLYSEYSESDNKLVVTKVFWAFTLIQLFFWILPLTLGTSEKVNRLTKHIVILDIITDIPLIITTLASGAYAVQFWIFCDLIFKMLLMLRGVVINGCIYILLPALE